MRWLAIVALVVTSFTHADQDRYSGPIIDVHTHAEPLSRYGPHPMGLCTDTKTLPTWDPQVPYGAVWGGWLANPPCEDPVWAPETDEEIMRQSIAAMQKLNIIGILSGPAELSALWMSEAPDRFIAGREFRIGRDTPTVAELRQEYESGKFAVLAEVTNQYNGIEPDDPRMAEYWALAAELDFPVGIHIGTGPPGVIYLDSDQYRARMHSPLALEEVLVANPGLRVYVMHAGYPMLDDTLALLYAHPHVYVGVGVLVWGLPPTEFHRYLQTLVEAGYGKRVMFGSDQMVWPGVMERAVERIQSADYLDHEQKADILFNNAARFLRLDPAQFSTEGNQ